MRLVSRPGRSSVCAVVALALVASACAGPKKRLHVEGKSVVLDVLLGGRKAVAAAPVPPAGFVLGPSGLPDFSFDIPLPQPRRPRPPRVPSLCSDPSTVPPEGPRWALMPPEATYTYRAAGSFKVGGANAAEVPVPETATLEIHDARVTLDPLGLNFYWKASVTLGKVTTTTSYRSSIPAVAEVVADGQFRDGVLYPKPPDESAVWPGGQDAAGPVGPARGTAVVPSYPAPTTGDVAQPPRGIHFGLFIESVDTRVADDALDQAAAESGAAVEKTPAAGTPASAAATSFRPPAPGLLLAKYPLEVASTFDVTGGDGERTMSYRAEVRPRVAVHACRFAFDTWTIELTRGQVSDTRTGEVVDFTARYQVATTLGGLFVDDELHVWGSALSPDGVVPVDRTLKTTFETIDSFG